MYVARKSKCTCCHCKKEGFNTEFIPLTMHNKMTAYVCSEECRKLLSEEDVLKLNIKYWFITCTKRNMTKSLNSYYSKWVNNFELDDLKLIENTLNQQWREISSFMAYKDFAHGTGAFKYLMAMLESKLEKEKKLRNEIENFKSFETDIPVQTNTKTTIKRKKDISKWL